MHDPCFRFDGIFCRLVDCFVYGPSFWGAPGRDPSERLGTRRPKESTFKKKIHHYNGFSGPHLGNYTIHYGQSLCNVFVRYSNRHPTLTSLFSFLFSILASRFFFRFPPSFLLSSLLSFPQPLFLHHKKRGMRQNQVQEQQRK